MSKRKDFEVILKNLDVHDPAEMHDVLKMLEKQKGKYYEQQAIRLRVLLKRMKA